MVDRQVTCVDVASSSHGHEGISVLGKPGEWRMTRKEVVDTIILRFGTFYTRDQFGNRAEVRARRGAFGWYVQTEADGKWTNNLLSLDSCSVPGYPRVF